MLHDFDLNLLVYLNALLDLRSVSKAAAREHITQSAMSLALSRLRNHFGDELLVPSSGRTMVLTALAQSLVEPVREAIMRIVAVSTTVSSFDPATSKRKFTIDASGYAICVLLYSMVADLDRQALGLRIEMRTLDLDLFKGGADHDVIISSTEIHAHDIHSEELWQDTLTCVVWTENRLVGNEVTLKQYKELRHVFSDLEKDIRISSHVTQGADVRVPEMSMVPHAIMNTNRIAILPLRLAQIYAKQCPLRLVPCPFEIPPFTVYVYWHYSQERDPGLSWLRNQLKAAVVRMP